MSIAKILRNLADILDPPPPQIELVKPRKSVKISGEEIFRIIEKVIPESAHVYISDNEYWLCSKEDVEAFLAQDETNKLGYVPESFDCDDFSYRLMGQVSSPGWSQVAIGIVWTDKHALNCFVSDEKKFYLIEPQTDAVQVNLDTWQGSEIMLVVL